MVQIHETEVKLDDSEKLTYYTCGITINPNFTLMSEVDQEKLKMIGRVFLSRIDTYFQQPEILRGETKCYFQLERGEKKQSDHLQISVHWSTEYKKYTQFDLTKMRDQLNGTIQKVFKTDRNVHLDVTNISRDAGRMMKQYVRKK